MLDASGNTIVLPPRVLGAILTLVADLNDSTPGAMQPKEFRHDGSLYTVARKVEGGGIHVYIAYETFRKESILKQIDHHKGEIAKNRLTRPADMVAGSEHERQFNALISERAPIITGHQRELNRLLEEKRNLPQDVEFTLGLEWVGNFLYTVTAYDPLTRNMIQLPVFQVVREMPEVAPQPEPTTPPAAASEVKPADPVKDEADNDDALELGTLQWALAKWTELGYDPSKGHVLLVTEDTFDAICEESLHVPGRNGEAYVWPDPTQVDVKEPEVEAMAAPLLFFPMWVAPVEDEGMGPKTHPAQEDVLAMVIDVLSKIGQQAPESSTITLRGGVLAGTSFQTHKSVKWLYVDESKQVHLSDVRPVSPHYERIEDSDDFLWVDPVSTDEQTAKPEGASSQGNTDVAPKPATGEDLTADALKAMTPQKRNAAIGKLPHGKLLEIAAGLGVKRNGKREDIIARVKEALKA